MVQHLGTSGARLCIDLAAQIDRFCSDVRSPRVRTSMAPRHGWIGVDLDGTLAKYDGWMGIENIGDPVPLMLSRVKRWVSEGKEVRIFTARVSHPTRAKIATCAIGDWCEKHGLPRLPVTNTKDFGMIELWDDRAVQVEANNGKRVADQVEHQMIRRTEARGEGNGIIVDAILSGMTAEKVERLRDFANLLEYACKVELHARSAPSGGEQVSTGPDRDAVPRTRQRDGAA